MTPACPPSRPGTRLTAHLGRYRASALGSGARIDFQRLLIGINARGDLSRVVTANLPAEVGVGRACLITHKPILTGLEGLQ